MKTYYHTTADGRKLLVGQLDDNHLENSINLIARRIREAKEIRKAGVVEDNLDYISAGFDTE